MLPTSIKSVLAICVLGLGVAGPPASASEFITVTAPTDLVVRETVNASLGTMSGAHSARIRANSLIASLFLSNSEGQTVVLPGELKLAPIVIPQGARDFLDRLKLCASLNTINGHYALIGVAPELGPVQSTTGSVLSAISFETDHKNILENRYSDETFIGRSFIAPACAASQTSYYMPISFTDNPDQLNITFEVTSGTVNPTLRAILADGSLSQNTPVTMTCLATRRLTAGFDCAVKLDLFEPQIADLEYSGLVELRLEMTDGRETSFIETRLSVPLQ
ncbi:hypothetical protein [Thalassobacter stenotrophicus]|uniref:hypothetical protein n=1 Tax=Thalassobacter stenotrophicus TaxID=266809 RepID=UPI001057C61C|nr:hypothetical protein [Thalassobacter stenotrophicus]